MKLRFLAISLLTLTACNESTIPAFEGRIVNHSSLPTESFQVTYTLKCRKESFVGPRPSCGYATQSAQVKANGSYAMPAIEVASGGSTYELDISVEAKVDGIPRGVLHETFLFSDGDITSEAPAYKDITVLEFAEQELRYELASGIASERWAEGQGRDSVLNYTFDFSLGKDDPIFGARVRRLRTGFFDQGNILTLPRAFFFLPGVHGTDAPVRVTAKLENWHLTGENLVLGTMTGDIPFARELPLSLRRFSVDDRALPEIRRTIDGTWPLTLNFHRQYRHDRESNLFDAKLDVRCLNGRIDGTMHLASRPANKRAFDGTVNVGGRCSDESGVLEFRFQYANDVDEALVQVPYDKIGGGAKRRTLYTRDLREDNMAVYSGKKITMLLPLLVDGKSEGQLSPGN